MNHPIIVNAFQHASERNSDTIYLIFKRQGIMFKDTYLVLCGNKQTVELAILKNYADVEEEKLNYPRADHIELLDTPFDNWCGRACISDSIQCSNKTAIKCSSNWQHMEYTSEEEMHKYIKHIKPGYYANYTIEYL